jgi:DNA-binding NarL/FixJ family response regulator
MEPGCYVARAPNGTGDRVEPRGGSYLLWQSATLRVRLILVDTPSSAAPDQSSPSVRAPFEVAPRASTTPVRVVIVDDHALVREGTVQLLTQVADIEVVGQAGSGEEALRVFEELRPDVALIDVNLPGMSGLELARHASASQGNLRVLIVSAYDDYAYVAEALEIGVGGYLLKTASARELVDAVRAVADGVFVLDRAVSGRLTRRARSGPSNDEALTRRETDVLELLARGRSNKQIANELTLGLRTVEGHVSNILAKLGVQSRTEAVAYALGRRLVVPEDHGNSHNAS